MGLSARVSYRADGVRLPNGVSGVLLPVHWEVDKMGLMHGVELKRPAKVDISRLQIFEKQNAAVRVDLDAQFGKLVRHFDIIGNGAERLRVKRWGWVELEEFAKALSERRSWVAQEAERWGSADVVGLFYTIADMVTQEAFSLSNVWHNYSRITYLAVDLGREPFLQTLYGFTRFEFLKDNGQLGSRYDDPPGRQYFFPAGWAKTVWFLIAGGTRRIVQVPHVHYGVHNECSLVGSIRCDHLPEDDDKSLTLPRYMHIGLVPVNQDGWPILKK